MSLMSDDSSSVSRTQIAEAYLQALRLIDDRVTPFLGKATTRVLVQGLPSDSRVPIHFYIFLPRCLIPKLSHQ